VLRTVADYRFATTKQLEVLHFSAHSTTDSAARTCRRVLQRLRDQRIVRSLERRIGGVRAGSAGFVWTTDTLGRRLLAEASGGHWRRHHEPSARFLQHAVAIVDARVALERAQRGGRLELLEVTPEPGCWRRYVGPSGSAAVLQPDLAVTTGVGEYEDAWFVEIDLGTEHLPTLLRKCEQYETYRRTGLEQQRYGAFPYVVWVLATIRRAEQLRTAINRASHLDASLYQLTTPAGLAFVLANAQPPIGGDDA
jgi:hypothetical protein